jgi:hypothetical protein
MEVEAASVAGENGRLGSGTTCPFVLRQNLNGPAWTSFGHTDWLGLPDYLSFTTACSTTANQVLYETGLTQTTSTRQTALLELSLFLLT